MRLIFQEGGFKISDGITLINTEEVLKKYKSGSGESDVVSPDKLMDEYITLGTLIQENVKKQKEILVVLKDDFTIFSRTNYPAFYL